MRYTIKAFVPVNEEDPEVYNSLGDASLVAFELQAQYPENIYHIVELVLTDEDAG